MPHSATDYPRIFHDPKELTLAVLGCAKSGKSSLCKRLILPLPDQYTTDYEPTCVYSVQNNNLVKNTDWFYWGSVSRRVGDDCLTTFNIIERSFTHTSGIISYYKSRHNYQSTLCCELLTIRLKLPKGQINSSKNDTLQKRTSLIESLSPTEVEIDGVLLLVDPQSFLDGSTDFISHLASFFIKRKKPFVLVLSKCDISDRECLAHVKSWLKSSGDFKKVPYVETSSTKNINIEEAFLNLARLVFSKSRSLKLCPNISYAEAVHEYHKKLVSAREAFKKRLSSSTAEYLKDWSTFYHRFSHQADIAGYVDLVGTKKAAKFFEDQVLELTNLLRHRYLDKIPNALLRLLPSFGRVRNRSFPEIIALLRSHPCFHELFIDDYLEFIYLLVKQKDDLDVNSGFKRDPVLETSVEFICAAKANSSFYSRQALHQQRFNLLRTAPNASILSPANDRIPFHLVLMGRDGLNALSIEQLSTLIGFSALGSSEKGMLCHLAIPLPLHDSPLTFHLIRLEREDRQLTCMAFFETALFVYQAAAALAHFEPRISPRQPAHFCISKFGLSIAAESAETGLPPILPGQPLAEVERLLAPTLARIETLALCGSLGPGETCFTERDKQKVYLRFQVELRCYARAHFNNLLLERIDLFFQAALSYQQRLLLAIGKLREATNSNINPSGSTCVKVPCVSSRNAISATSTSSEWTGFRDRLLSFSSRWHMLLQQQQQQQQHSHQTSQGVNPLLQSSSGINSSVSNQKLLSTLSSPSSMPSPALTSHTASLPPPPPPRFMKETCLGWIAAQLAGDSRYQTMAYLQSERQTSLLAHLDLLLPHPCISMPSFSLNQQYLHQQHAPSKVNYHASDEVVVSPAEAHMLPYSLKLTGGSDIHFGHIALGDVTSDGPFLGLSSMQARFQGLYGSPNMTGAYCGVNSEATSTTIAIGGQSSEVGLAPTSLVAQCPYQQANTCADLLPSHLLASAISKLVSRSSLSHSQMSTSAACPSTPRNQLSVSPGSPQTDLTAPRRLSLAICCFCGDVSGMLATLHLLLGVGFRPDFQYGVGPTDSDQKTLALGKRSHSGATFASSVTCGVDCNSSLGSRSSSGPITVLRRRRSNCAASTRSVAFSLGSAKSSWTSEPAYYACAASPTNTFSLPPHSGSSSVFNVANNTSSVSCSSFLGSSTAKTHLSPPRMTSCAAVVSPGGAAAAVSPVDTGVGAFSDETLSRIDISSAPLTLTATWPLPVSRLPVAPIPRLPKRCGELRQPILPAMRSEVGHVRPLVQPAIDAGGDRASSIVNDFGDPSFLTANEMDIRCSTLTGLVSVSLLSQHQLLRHHINSLVSPAINSRYSTSAPFDGVLFVLGNLHDQSQVSPIKGLSGSSNQPFLLQVNTTKSARASVAETSSLDSSLSSVPYSAVQTFGTPVSVSVTNAELAKPVQDACKPHSCIGTDSFIAENLPELVKQPYTGSSALSIVSPGCHHPCKLAEHDSACVIPYQRDNQSESRYAEPSNKGQVTNLPIRGLERKHCLPLCPCASCRAITFAGQNQDSNGDSHLRLGHQYCLGTTAGAFGTEMCTTCWCQPLPACSCCQFDREFSDDLLRSGMRLVPADNPDRALESGRAVLDLGSSVCGTCCHVFSTGHPLAARLVCPFSAPHEALGASQHSMNPSAVECPSSATQSARVRFLSTWLSSNDFTFESRQKAVKSILRCLPDSLPRLILQALPQSHGRTSYAVLPISASSTSYAWGCHTQDCILGANERTAPTEQSSLSRSDSSFVASDSHSITCTNNTISSMPLNSSLMSAASDVCSVHRCARSMAKSRSLEQTIADTLGQTPLGKHTPLSPESNSVLSEGTPAQASARSVTSPILDVGTEASADDHEANHSCEFQFQLIC